jgi:hypothetical protein
VDEDQLNRQRRENVDRQRGRTDAQDRSARRVSESRQRELVREQERRFTRHSDRQRQWEYEERQRRHWRERQDWRRYDYDRDPYFWTSPSWRYSYGGRWYEINDYGRDVLNQAVNYGYEEGFYAGQADREDNWRRGYRENYVYEDADYGYTGLYVEQEQYAHYFREGFRRGYEDGYNRRYRYGRKDDKGKLAILAGVVAGILIIDAID